MDEQQLELSPRKRLACNISAAIILTASVIFLALCYFHVIDIEFGNVATGCLVGALGIIFFVNSLIQHNSVSMWLSAAFLVPAAVSLACRCGSMSYSQLYPLYIAIPGIGCLMAMPLSKKLTGLFKAIVFFICAAAIFLLEVFDVLSLGWTFVVLGVYVAAWIIYTVIYLTKGENK